MNKRSCKLRVKRSDSRKMQSCYQQYYSQNLQNAADSTDSAQVTKAQSTANVPLEVLKAVREELEVDPKVLEAHVKLTQALNQRLT